MNPPRDIEIEPAEVRRKLDAGEKFRVIDTREDFEREICKLPGSEQLTEALYNDLIARGDREAEYVFSCHHGVRSLQAAIHFAGLGFRNVRSMRGGIEAWALEVDPSTPRY